MCGKRFGNQWFWQVGALLVALQVYNHSFRSSPARQPIFLSVLYPLPRFLVGAAIRDRACCVEDELESWRTENFGVETKAKVYSSSVLLLKRSIFFSSPVSIKMTVFRIFLSIRVVILFYSARGMRELTSRLSIFLQEATLYNSSMQRSSVTK